MNPKKTNRWLTFSVVVLFAAVVGWVAHTAGQLDDLHAQVADLQQQLATETKSAKAYAADAVHWRKQAESLLGQAGGLQKAAATSTDPSARKRNFTTEELQTIGKNPALQNIISSQQTAILNTTYAALLDHLKLAPDERDYMQKLLLEKQMVQVTLGMQMMDPTLPADQRAALGRQIGEGLAAEDAKIHDFLNSDQDFAYYQTYAQQEPERLEVGMFAQSLDGANALDPATSDQLATMLNDSRNTYPFTVNFYDHRNFGNPAVLNSAAVNQFLDEQTKYQAAVAEKAATLLNPAQLEAFKQNQAAMRQMTKMQLNSILQLSGGNGQ
ncbi:MAG TPA: hypothetical protein VHC95_08120 [Opitutales bacterium]|nr:hypothetical protein [Opitutales bacterium]